MECHTLSWARMLGQIFEYFSIHFEGAADAPVTTVCKGAGTSLHSLSLLLDNARCSWDRLT